MGGNIEVVLVDIGNTSIKSAVVSNGSMREIRKWTTLEELKGEYSSETDFMVCSTRSEAVPMAKVQVLNYQTSLPIDLAYKTPETLGADRIAAAVGAFELFPKTNSLVIDLGTCITMDLVTLDGIFKGGIISPGLHMRMKSMAQFTENLPDISSLWQDLPQNTLGKSTYECLLAGAYGGIVNEIKGVLDHLSKDFTSINVILTGGDAVHFESKVKAHIFAGSKIVLTGLYRVWKGL